jgi:hypothetical protein
LFFGIRVFISGFFPNQYTADKYITTQQGHYEVSNPDEYAAKICKMQMIDAINYFMVNNFSPGNVLNNSCPSFKR